MGRGSDDARRRIDLARDVKLEREGDVPWLDERGAWFSGIDNSGALMVLMSADHWKEIMFFAGSGWGDADDLAAAVTEVERMAAAIDPVDDPDFGRLILLGAVQPREEF